METITLTTEADALALTHRLNALISAYQPTAPRPVLSHCAICACALTDAASIEVGIGPVCRERCGYDSIPEAKRLQANRLIAEVATNLQDRARIMVCADQLREMGLDKLAAALVSRFATVILAELDAGIAVKAPYAPAFAQAMRAAGGQFGHIRAGRIGRGWLVPKTWEAAIALRSALAANFAGCCAKATAGESFWI